METGLKAAPPLSKMPAELWKSSGGQTKSLFEAPRQPRKRYWYRPEIWERRKRAATAATLGVARAPGARLKILIVTDAWAPQVNGVVRTLEMLGKDLRSLGHEVRYATPDGYFT